MNLTLSEVLEYVNENDVKFVRLAFCDLLGTMKNVSIMTSEIERAFSEGISFDASSIRGFTDVTQSDMFLHPVTSTLMVLPWRPQQGRVIRFLCDIKNPDGTPFVEDSRFILKKAIERCFKLGYSCRIAPECEFYLFKTDENGDPTHIPHDNGGYFDVTPIDKGENVRREICLCLDEIGINPESSHHEQGPGQHEVVFKYSDALIAADNFLTFKWVVKTIAARNGLFASFMPKPVKDKSGNGLHINISLLQNNENIFKMENPAHEKIAENFIAGVLNRIRDITAFLNPIPNSYDRFGSFEAPKYVSWSHQNRSQLIRLPATIGNLSRMELRSPDPSANPYLAFALILHAGLDGIEENQILPEPLDINLFTAGEHEVKGIPVLPQSLGEAIELSQNSAFVKNVLGESLLRKYTELKKRENADFLEAADSRQFNDERYFPLI